MTYSSNKLQKVETKPVAWTAFQSPARQLENIIYIYCIVLQNKKSDVYPSRAFPFCFNKGYFAIIDMSQRTASPCFFL